MKYKISLSYDGTEFGGWQVQPNAPSIQENIQETLSIILREQVEVTGASRTDAGVHAAGQVAHFSTDSTIDPKRLIASLNALLPETIRVHDLTHVADDFHARYEARRKIYHYHLYLHPTLDPFRRRFATHIPYPLDRQLLSDACHHFIGTHDFTSFANEGGAAKTKVRTIYRLECIQEEPHLLRLEFEGDGFLYKMVRNIVGTLLDIARGYTPLEKLPSIFAAKDRRAAGLSAPPQGLFLMKVIY